jgi:hypothetical protein
MSTLTRIEAALKGMDQAGFHQLCDAYLKRRGYRNLNSIGLSLGAEKTTTGTPDTLVSQPDGTYVFNEYTTQQTGVAAKFHEDLDKCFDEEKTGIPAARISEVILCHNGKLSTTDSYSLEEKCRTHGPAPTILGLGMLAHEIYDKYPKLAKDFFGIEVDTGQILHVDDFVEVYSRGTLATPLTTALHFKEDDVTAVTQALETSNVVFVTGRPGVGKSRIAVECARRHAANHQDDQVWCVFNRGIDLFQDLHEHFAAPGHYLFLIDDANRLPSFEYALDLLRNARPDRTFKIIATVRDYAIKSVQNAARIYGSSDPIEIKPLTEEQIRTLVEKEYGINHPAYLERIAAIADGNPRLAIMAARVAIKADSLDSLSDVSALYEDYYSSVRDDISELKDPTMLLVAGIVAFFRIVDRSNAEMMGAIADTFDIDPETFWAAVSRLHKMEVFDLHADEVVRVSDQVLATYLFYLAVFREKSLDFAALLTTFFPQNRQRFIEVLNPVASTFGGESIAELLRPYLLEARKVFKQRGDDDAVLDLLDAFATLMPTDALIAVDELVGEREPEGVDKSVSFKESSALPPSPSVLSILGQFHHASDAESAIAIELMVAYLNRAPADAPLVVRTLNDGFGIRHTSYLEGFAVQVRTADLLVKASDAGRNEMASRLFLAYAGAQLQVRFHRMEAQRGLTYRIYDIHLLPTQELISLRHSLWTQVFSLQNVPPLTDQVVDLLDAYVRNGRDRASKEVIASDAPALIEFFLQAFDPSNYRHAAVVREYVALLHWLEIGGSEALAELFAGGDAFRLYDILLHDTEMRTELGWEEYGKQRRVRIEAFAATLDSDSLRSFLSQVAEMRRMIDPEHGHQLWQLESSVSEILSAVNRQSAELFSEVLLEHIHAGNPLNLQPDMLAVELIQSHGSGDAYDLLAAGDYPGRWAWLLGYFMVIPEAEVTPTYLEEMYRAYEEAPAELLVRGLDHLLKFTTLDPQVIVRVTQIILDRLDSDPLLGRLLASLFNRHADLWKEMPGLFSGETELLKRAYFEASRAYPNTDHSGAGFDLLLTLDPGFAQEWISWVHSAGPVYRGRADSRTYTRIWSRTDATDVMRNIVAAIIAEDATGKFHFDSYLTPFFRVEDNGSEVSVVQAKQDAFLDDMIRTNCNDARVMSLVFEVVSELPAERRRARVATFVGCTSDFDAFRVLRLEPSGGIYRGSGVPMYTERLSFFQSLVPLLDSVALLKHRHYVNEQIARVRETIEREKKRDFMRD